MAGSFDFTSGCLEKVSRSTLCAANASSGSNFAKLPAFRRGTSGQRHPPSLALRGEHVPWGRVNWTHESSAAPIEAHMLVILMTGRDVWTRAPGMRESVVNNGGSRIPAQDRRPGVPTRKIKRLRDADPCLLSPTSALERITDSSQTSRQVQKPAQERPCQS
jgi:hypothetical protein